MTTFNYVWEEFSRMLTGSSLTERQKYWLLLRLQVILTKEIDAAEKSMININTKLEESAGCLTAPLGKMKAEKAVAHDYQKAYIPLQDCLNRYCKEMIECIEELTATEKDELTESLNEPTQCSNPNTRKRIRKLLCGFDTNKKRLNSPKQDTGRMHHPLCRSGESTPF